MLSSARYTRNCYKPIAPIGPKCTDVIPACLNRTGVPTNVMEDLWLWWRSANSRWRKMANTFFCVYCPVRASPRRMKRERVENAFACVRAFAFYLLNPLVRIHLNVLRLRFQTDSSFNHRFSTNNADDLYGFRFGFTLIQFIRVLYLYSFWPTYSINYS